jgi:hypothetical protein
VEVGSEADHATFLRDEVLLQIAPVFDKPSLQ